MPETDIRQQWERAAAGWARWEARIAAWMQPATDAMLAMADVRAGARVLDLASGAGSQTLDAARRVGAQGSVVGSDISEVMLRHVRDNARAAGVAQPLAQPRPGYLYDCSMGWRRSRKTGATWGRVESGFGGRCPECGTGLADVRAQSVGVVTGWCPDHAEVESRTS